MSKVESVSAQQHLATCVNAGDVDAGVEAFAEDAVDHDHAPGQGPGREGFRTFWKMMVAAFPDARIEPRHEVVDDEHVVVAYTLTGTPSGRVSGHRADRQARRHQRCPGRSLRERQARRPMRTSSRRKRRVSWPADRPARGSKPRRPLERAAWEVHSAGRRGCCSGRTDGVRLPASPAVPQER